MADDRMEDREIVARCAAGETEAFAWIVRKYQDQVLAVAWSVLGNREDSRDAAQDVFVQCFQNLHRFDAAREFKNWLMAIAYKRCLDRRRRAAAFRRFMPRFVFRPSFSVRSRREADRESADALDPILRPLRPVERAIVVMKAVDGLTFREIAAALHCSEGSARVRFFNAKRKVRRNAERTSHV